MERRQFLKSSCTACALATAGFLLPQLTGCSPAAYKVYKTSITNNKLSVPLSLFEQSPIQIIRPNGWYYDVAVQKNADQSFTALLLQCTHQENQLTPTGNGYRCSLHGSEFDKSGKVKKGPASSPLEQYATSVEDNNLLIQLKNT